MSGLLTVKALASLMGVSPCTIYRLEREGGLPSLRGKGLGIRFKQNDIDAWMEDRKSKILPNITFAILTTPRGHTNKTSYGEKGGLGEMAKAKSRARLNFRYGAIYQRKTKKGTIRWYLDYRDAKGKRVQKLVVQAISEGDALRALQASVLKELHRAYGLPAARQDVKFSEFSQTYIDDYAKQHKKSWRDDQYRLEANMIPFFGSLCLHEITSQTIEQYRAKRLKSGVSRSTVNRELTILKKMFNLAVDWGLAQSNPATKVKLFSENDTQKERILAHDEEARLLAESPDYLKPILVIALNTGMRRGEILNLRWDQVDLRGRQIAVRKTKSGKDRLIPISSRLLSVFSLLGPHRGESRLVFPNPATGRPYTEVKKSFKMACERAGIEGLRFHDLRHTFATRLVKAGVDIITVRDLLGHFSIRVTQRYTHPGQGQKVAAVELLAQNGAPSEGNLLRPCYTN